jgi:alpha-1,2-mannosyltransferase
VTAGDRAAPRASRSRLGPWRLLVDGILIAGAVVVAVALLDAFLLVVTGEHEVVDFRAYDGAAEALLRGDSLYPSVDESTLASGREYVYPPLVAIAAVPLALLPLSIAEGLVVVGLALGVIATLLVVGVRDWRCYVVAFLWVPVLNAVGLGNITVLLGLAAAFAWRYRARALPAATAVGVTLAAKIFLWPLVVWLAATRRLRAALLSCVIGAGLLALSWAVVGLDGIRDYGELVRLIQSLSDDDAYSVYAIALDAGAPDALARLLWLGVAVVLLAGSVVLGRRGDERGAFVLAIAAALAFSPVVWRHYFELLLVAVAVARPTLGVVWFVPPAMWLVSTGSGNGTWRQTSATLVVAGVTVVLALASSRSASPRGGGGRIAANVQPEVT